MPTAPYHDTPTAPYHDTPYQGQDEYAPNYSPPSIDPRGGLIDPQGGLIDSQGGLKPYEWTDRDATSFTFAVPTFQIRTLPVAYEEPSTYHPTSDPLEVTSLDANTPVSSRWWKVFFAGLFIVLAALFWWVMVKYLTGMFISDRVSLVIANLLYAVVFTFLALLILWFVM